MTDDRDQGLDKSVSKQVSNFGFGDDVSNTVDARTIINAPDLGLQLLYYRTLGSAFKCDIADLIADTLERLMISVKGRGREQCVMALQQKFPKTEKLYQEVEQLPDMREET